MNDLSGAGESRWSCDPIPSPLPCILVPIFVAGLAISLFILAVVHNALLLAVLLLIAVFVLALVMWNIYSFRSYQTAHLFLDRLPPSSLLGAADGQLVKITGLVACGDLSLESSYEKVGRCVYTSTLLYEYRGIGPNIRSANWCCKWNLTHLERITADFYITDIKSGIRALVKAGYDSKVLPLVEENITVNTSSKNRELSSTLKKWLEARNLSADARLLRLEEGYIMEGSLLTVMGMLSRKSGDLMIVQPPEPISTGCLLRRFLLPADIDGIVFRISDMTTSRVNLSIS